LAQARFILNEEELINHGRAEAGPYLIGGQMKVSNEGERCDITLSHPL